MDLKLELTVIVPEGYTALLKHADPGVEVYVALIKPFPLVKNASN